MIDTVILEIPQIDYIITDHEQFNPTTHNITSSRTLLMKHVNNPTSQDKKQGIYKPRLTIMKRSYKEIPLKIEFSAPKLLFGNNIDEMRNADLPRVANNLHKALLTMGVSISIHAIMTAKVLAIHYSKNIKLAKGYTSSLVIKELAKINLTQKLDLSKTQFKNEGHSLQYYAASHSFVIYDKIKDLKQSKGRASDKDQNHLQSSIFDIIQESAESTEILRFEVRLCKRRKLKTMLKKVGFANENPKLAELFNSQTSKAILTHYWKEMVLNQNIFLFTGNKDPLQILTQLLQTAKPQRAIYLIGLFLISKEKGIRELRQTLAQHASDRTWYRIQNDLQELNSLATTNQIYSFISDIQTQLDSFKPYKLNKEIDLPLC